MMIAVMFIAAVVVLRFGDAESLVNSDGDNHGGGRPLETSEEVREEVLAEAWPLLVPPDFISVQERQ